MQLIGLRQKQFRRITRVVLFAFVVSWVNMIFQMPVHAAMMQSQSQVKTGHHADMKNCHCPPPLCETVISVEDQSISGLNISHTDVIDFQVVYVQITSESGQQLLSDLRLDLAEFLYREHSPPPLQLTTTLLI